MPPVHILAGHNMCENLREYEGQGALLSSLPLTEVMIWKNFRAN